MKKITNNKIAIVLVISLVLNIVLIVYSLNQQRDKRTLSVAVSSTFGLVFDAHEKFYADYEKYKNGEMEIERLERSADMTSFQMLKLSNIMNSFEFIPKEYSKSMNDLMIYYIDFKSYTETERLETIEELNELIRKNHVVSVSQFYDNIPTFTKGKMPDEIINLFIGIDELVEHD